MRGCHGCFWGFLQVDMPEDETVHVRLTGIMVDTLLEIEQDLYEPFVAQEGKEKVLYLELLKALYGTLHAKLIRKTTGVGVRGESV